jgi:hypothetical protein
MGHPRFDLDTFLQVRLAAAPCPRRNAAKRGRRCVDRGKPSSPWHRTPRPARGLRPRRARGRGRDAANGPARAKQARGRDGVASSDVQAPPSGVGARSFLKGCSRGEEVRSGDKVRGLRRPWNAGRRGKKRSQGAGRARLAGGCARGRRAPAACAAHGQARPPCPGARSFDINRMREERRRRSADQRSPSGFPGARGEQERGP